MAKFRLKQESDFVKRVDELMTKADELGISIDFSNCNMRTFIKDTKSGSEYFLEDMEKDEPITSFPSSFEYRITFEK